jgi:hypothetical protein
MNYTWEQINTEVKRLVDNPFTGMSRLTDYELHQVKGSLHPVISNAIHAATVANTAAVNMHHLYNLANGLTEAEFTKVAGLMKMTVNHAK